MFHVDFFGRPCSISSLKQVDGVAEAKAAMLTPLIDVILTFCQTHGLQVLLNIVYCTLHFTTLCLPRLRYLKHFIICCNLMSPCWINVSISKELIEWCVCCKNNDCSQTAPRFWRHGSVWFRDSRGKKTKDKITFFFLLNSGLLNKLLFFSNYN